MKRSLLHSIFSLLFLLACTTNQYAQNETSKWMFGSYAGLDFSGAIPFSIPSPSMVTGEASASIADAAGNLLFYTNGVDVWNASHALMANGTGLLGDVSSTQCMIVKRPGSATEYYIFYIEDAGGPNGLMYATVDMALAAGMGSVTAKNLQLYTPCSEKLAAVKHCNGTDVWLLSHELNGNNFKAYLVTAAGVNPVPVVTPIGTAYSYVYPLSTGLLGQMKFSPNGRRVSATVSIFGTSFETAYAELFDFDNSTGILSNLQTLNPNAGWGYGCEFSQDGTKLYASFCSNIVQWDLCANNATTSAQTVFGGNANYLHALQLASNGKIYVSRPGAFLGVINNPNVAGGSWNYGSGFGYTDSGPYLVPYNNILPMNAWGLPGFAAHHFFMPIPPTFTYVQSCQSVTFTPGLQACSASSLFWDFGDQDVGASNTSSLTTPAHFYQSPGTYTVKLITYTNCFSDTISMPITIGSAPVPALGVSGSFTICNGQAATYTANGGNAYSWSTGSNTATITVTPSLTTVYSVTTTHTANSCQAAKIFTVFVTICTGIEYLQAANGEQFSISPNPAQDQVVIETNEEGTLRIYNALGGLIAEQNIPAGKIRLDMSRFNNGVYTFQRINGSGKKIARLVKTD